jgi:hypothetical protein
MAGLVIRARQIGHHMIRVSVGDSGTNQHRFIVVVVFDQKVPHHGGWCREQQSTAANNYIFKNQFH